MMDVKRPEMRTGALDRPTELPEEERLLVQHRRAANAVDERALPAEAIVERRLSVAKSSSPGPADPCTHRLVAPVCSRGSERLGDSRMLVAPGIHLRGPGATRCRGLP
jgi:hypothetical protein